MQAGGYLWINIAGSNCVNDFAPGGVDFLQYTCGGSLNQSAQIVNPVHNYISGAFDPNSTSLVAADFLNWNVTDLGHLSGLPAHGTTITRNPQGSTLAEYSYGQGWVVLSTLTYGWGDGGAKGSPMDNMLLYAADQVRSSSGPTPAVPEPGSLLFTAGGLLIGLSWRRLRH